MVNNRNICTFIDFGTEKICILIARLEKNMPEVLSFQEEISKGAIVKGCIFDYEAVEDILRNLLSKTKLPYNISPKIGKVYYTLNGDDIQAKDCKGYVTIDSEDHIIAERHVKKAIEKAQNINLANDRICIGFFDSYFLIDGQKKVFAPEGMFANSLESHLQMISAGSSENETINEILSNLGFDNEGHPVFSAIASAYGALSADERERGTLLIDLGAGCSDYVLVYGDGLYCCGVLPVGTNHIANDLSIMLNLPYEYCSELLHAANQEQRYDEKYIVAEYVRNDSVCKRKIPILSVNRVIEARFAEIFDIIKERILSKKLLSLIQSSVVLCGGGSNIFQQERCQVEAFHIPVRKADKIKILSHELKDNVCPAMYTALVGMVKYAIECENIMVPPSYTEKMLRKIITQMKNIVGGAKNE